jgi:hypothetical protein
MSPRKPKKPKANAAAAAPEVASAKPAPAVFTRRRAALIGSVAILVALCESALGLLQPKHIATDADWETAARYVRTQLQPHDLITFSPPFIDPVGRQHLGDHMPVEMVARPDDDLYARVFELSVHDAHNEALANIPVAEEIHFGLVTLRRYDKAAMRRLYDFTSQFSSAHVSTRVGDIETPCTVSGPAAICGPSRVEPRVLEIDYRPRYGILAPMVNGKTTVIAYDDVPGGGTLVGYVGLHDYYARKNGDAVVTFRVSVDETKSVTIPVRNPKKDGEGWQRFELPMDPGPHKVRFELETPDAHYRLPGFHAEVRSP